jgi:hypothetical protein
VIGRWLGELVLLTAARARNNDGFGDDVSGFMPDSLCWREERLGKCGIVGDASTDCWWLVSRPTNHRQALLRHHPKILSCSKDVQVQSSVSADGSACFDALSRFAVRRLALFRATYFRRRGVQRSESHARLLKRATEVFLGPKDWWQASRLHERDRLQWEDGSGRHACGCKPSR